MAKAIRDGVTFTVDERSIRSFKRRVDALITATGENAKEDLKEFCSEVLSTANDLIPIDTGTAAESAGYKIEKYGTGYRARMGYGIYRNPINPRTGKPASSYVGLIHESYQTTETSNGESKFFEKALYAHVADFYTKVGKSLRELLAVPTLPMTYSGGHSSDGLPTFLNISGRQNSGFTARNGGKILPYPLNSANKTKQKTTSKTAHSVRTKVSKRFATKKTATHKNFGA